MTEGVVYFEDVEIGDSIGPLERTVTTEQVREFLGIWRRERNDARFIDAEAARREGLPGPMVPGAINMALLSQLITSWSPWARLKKLDVVFRQVVLHNTPLLVTGLVTDKDVVDGERLLYCDVFIQDAQGGRLVIGQATVSLPSRRT